jgi:hypothetical protein
MGCRRAMCRALVQCDPLERRAWRASRNPRVPIPCSPCLAPSAPVFRGPPRRAETRLRPFFDRRGLRPGHDRRTPRPTLSETTAKTCRHTACPRQPSLQAKGSSRRRDAPDREVNPVKRAASFVGSTWEREELPNRRATRRAFRSGRCRIAELGVDARALRRVHRTGDLETHRERQRQRRQACNPRVASRARTRQRRRCRFHAPMFGAVLGRRYRTMPTRPVGRRLVPKALRNALGRRSTNRRHGR